MANPIYQQMNPAGNSNNMLQQIINFKKSIGGSNPQEIVQGMLNSGKITQSQFNQCAQQANQIYSQFKNLI